MLSQDNSPSPSSYTTSTTIATKDGDEGESKDYAWETVPDDDD